MNTAVSNASPGVTPNPTEQQATVLPGESNRRNNFNFLRLLFATLVLISHSSELVDGNRDREPLTMIFGTVSFGEVAVYGFFLLSGYLIVQSWQRNPSFFTFVTNRVLRIYPAFIVASIVSAFVVGPLGANSQQYFDDFNYLQFSKAACLLYVPHIPQVFEGQPYPSVNASMWTIQYEFRCYLLVALIGLCGLSARRPLWFALSAVALLVSLAPAIENTFTFPGSYLLFGDPTALVRLLAMFAAGGCFYLYRDYIHYKASWAMAAGLVLAAMMFDLNTARIGIPTLGAYLLFWFAFTPIPSLAWFQKSADISYGVYLYGWPTQKLLIWYVPTISPWLVFAATCVICVILGLISWHIVEQPFLKLKRRPAT